MEYVFGADDLAAWQDMLIQDQWAEAGDFGDDTMDAVEEAEQQQGPGLNSTSQTIWKSCPLEQSFLPLTR